ncbi:hypothetical protein NL676_002842 [Syzygium grande]|nr:hypothetical protein NL676_002842 [Syzygium grande]
MSRSRSPTSTRELGASGRRESSSDSVVSSGRNRRKKENKFSGLLIRGEMETRERAIVWLVAWRNLWGGAGGRRFLYTEGGPRTTGGFDFRVLSLDGNVAFVVNCGSFSLPPSLSVLSSPNFESHEARGETRDV